MGTFKPSINGKEWQGLQVTWYWEREEEIIISISWDIIIHNNTRVCSIFSGDILMCITMLFGLKIFVFKGSLCKPSQKAGVMLQTLKWPFCIIL